MRIRCDNTVVVRVVDDESENMGQGWHWKHAYSRVYEFSRQFTIPRDVQTQECEVRFYWSRVAYFDQEPYEDYNKAYISVLIPGGVDARTMGTVGRQLERTIVHTGSGSVSGTIEHSAGTSDSPNQEQAASRISPVMRVIEMDDGLRAGGTTTVVWELMSYHGPASSLVRIVCDDRVSSATDASPQDLGEGWYWGDVTSRRYRYETDLDIPSGASGDCTVRFYWSRQGYTDQNSAFISVLIPGGVDPRPSGDAGRVVVRTVW